MSRNNCLKYFQVSAHWHKGTTFMVKFEESVIARDKVPGD